MKLAESSQSKAITYVMTLCLVLHKNDLHPARQELGSTEKYTSARLFVILWKFDGARELYIARYKHVGFTKFATSCKYELKMPPLPYFQ
jgi:hypothetical protein